MTIENASLLELFRTEASEHLRSLNEHLLALERDPADRERVRAMFLSAHTIKGSAAMVGEPDIATIAHALEDALQPLRDPEVELGRGMPDLMFRALDAIHDLIERPQPDTSGEPLDLTQLLNSLRGQSPVPLSSAGEAIDCRSHLLLVENSATVRFLEQLTFIEAGFLVDEAANAEEALALLHRNAYRLIVSAIDLPGLSGLELTAAVRRLQVDKTVPIMLISIDEIPPEQDGISKDVHIFSGKGISTRGDLARIANSLVGGTGGSDASAGVMNAPAAGR